ncbi:MAG: aspartate carbamoyltransferase [Promethearchaeota archaeon]
MEFKGLDIISAKQFKRKDIEYMMDIAVKIEKDKEKYSDLLKGYILATLFFEPSTRTRLSFESAMLRLGGSVLGFQSSEVSSVKKGETLADTVRTVSNYSDVIVIRHPREGASKLAARFSDIPIINAGSGPGEHPTQALLDLLTIREEFGKIDGLNIGLVGDLKYGRTVHSLTILLSNYDVNLYLISPESLKMPNNIMDYLTRKGIEIENVYHKKPLKIKETKRFRQTLPILDVIYMTRIQKERFPDIEEYERVKYAFEFSPSELKLLKENAKIMHPLPRITEINPKIDNTKHAIYFKQTYYGLMMRKALLALVLGKIK